MQNVDRRSFLGTTGATAAGLAASSFASKARANGETPQKVIVGVIGTGGRGTAVARGFQNLEGVEVKTVCDVDRRRAEAAADAVGKIRGERPSDVTDFRRVLDDKDIDAVVVATCNHWHAPAAILAAKAGKHVYCEKPASHNPHEGELLVEAARKYDRRIQHGTQRRTWPAIVEGIQKVREGEIGRVYAAKGWYYNTRPSIGTGKEMPAPDYLDFDLWQGPAPRVSFRDNILHYNWHWFWDWGNGELGNNGVHYLDVCLWGLGLDGKEHAAHVSSGGGRFHWDDDQQTPDTHTVTYTWPDAEKTITWECVSCNRAELEGRGAFVAFFGTEGTLVVRGSGYTLHDLRGREIGKQDGPGGDPDHLQNFVDAVRTGSPLNAEIALGVKAAHLCHLGNIAHRTGRSLNVDPKSGKIVGDDAAMAYWKREYAEGWEPTV